jgi:Acetyltransferases, including N-acetylases of ribosomal proteins
MINIRTGRLEIRNFTIEDWKDLKEIVVDKEESEYAIYDHQFPTSDNDVRGIADWFSKDDNFLAVCEVTLSKVIGYISLNSDSENVKERNLGYCFHSAFHGKGYAIESCLATINYAFTTLNVECITSGTANLNHPSYKLLNKLGFVKTGESITSFRKPRMGILLSS